MRLRFPLYILLFVLSFFEDFKIKLIATNGSDLLSKMDGHYNLDLKLMKIEMPK